MSKEQALWLAAPGSAWKRTRAGRDHTGCFLWKANDCFVGQILKRLQGVLFCFHLGGVIWCMLELTTAKRNRFSSYMNLVNWNVSLQCLHLHKSLKCESWNPFGENVLNCFPFASNWVIGFVSDLIPNTNIAIRKEFTKQMHLAQIKVMFVTKQKGMFA